MKNLQVFFNLFIHFTGSSHRRVRDAYTFEDEDEDDYKPGL